MRITTKDRIAGFPATTIRTLLQQSRDGLARHGVGSVVGVDRRAGERLVDELQQLGYVMSSPQDPAYFQNTVLGNALANASAARPMRRATADRLVDEVVTRARAANGSEFGYVIVRLSVFGSYVSDQRLLGDIDLIVELAPRYADRDEQSRLEDERIRIALGAGKRLNPIDIAMWPRDEVLRFLKKRNGYISFHGLDDSIAAAADRRIIFEDSRFLKSRRSP